MTASERLALFEAAAAELVAAFDKRWGDEPQRKRENAISPRMEEALDALRRLL